MTSAQATHPGLVRQNNEDCVLSDDNLGIYVLADGIGGLDSGEVASALAVETVHEVLHSNIAHTAVDGYFDLIVHAMHTAHWEINTKALATSSYMRMGTTLVVAVLRENKAYIVHAGDSRCYLFQNRPHPHPDSPLEGRGNIFKRLTRDHTAGDQMLANGISIEDIPKKKFHNLTQSLGCRNPPSPDFEIAELKQGDMLLLCSDGLTDMLPDAEIGAILSNRNANLDKLVEDLIDAAIANGGRDNISVILVKAP